MDFRFKEARFCLHVVIHGPMEIEMILRYICEYDGIVADAKVAEIIDTVATGFEYEMSNPHFFSPFYHTPELKRTIHGHL